MSHGYMNIVGFGRIENIHIFVGHYVHVFRSNIIVHKYFVEIKYSLFIILSVLYIFFRLVRFLIKLPKMITWIIIDFGDFQIFCRAVILYSLLDKHSYKKDIINIKINYVYVIYLYNHWLSVGPAYTVGPFSP